MTRPWWDNAMKPDRAIAAAFLLALSSVASVTTAAAQHAAPIADGALYERAVRFNIHRVAPLVLNTRIVPHWRTGERERFTYRRETGEGRAEFISVDVATGKRTPAFDATVIAAGLTKAAGKAIDPQRLPFFDFDETLAGIRFSDGLKTWDCNSIGRDAPTPASPLLTPWRCRRPTANGWPL